eukprot:gene7180-11492_t
MNLGNIAEDEDLGMSSGEKHIFSRIVDGKSTNEEELYVDDMLEDDEDFEDFEDDEIEEVNFKKPQALKKKIITEEKEEELFPDYVILDSSKSKKEGPVLRFSELFKSPEIPLPDDAYIIKKKKMKKKKDGKLVHVDLEDKDDEVEKEFETMSYDVKIKKPKEEKKTERSEDSKKVKRKENHLDENSEEVLQRTDFKPLDLLDWENDIIWEENEEKKKPETVEEKSTTNEPKKLLKRRLKKDKYGQDMWGTFELYNPEDEKKLEKPIIPFSSQQKPNFLPFQNPPPPASPIQSSSQSQLPTAPYRLNFPQPQQFKMGFPMNNQMGFPMSMNQSPMFSKTKPFMGGPQFGQPPNPGGFKPMGMSPFQQPQQMMPNFQRSPSMPSTPLQGTMGFRNVMPGMTPPGTPNFNIQNQSMSQQGSTNKNILSSANAPISVSPGSGGGNTSTGTVSTPGSGTPIDLEKKQKKRHGRKKKVEEDEKTNESETPEVEAVEEEKKRDKNLTKIISLDLEKGDWLQQVIWDDNMGPEKPVNTKLILDLNDKNMIFQQHDKNASNIAAQKKSATGKITDSVEPILTRIETSHSFNLSNDRDYEGGGIHAFQKKGRHIVKHSLPALELDPTYFRTYIPIDELKLLHRPKYDIFPLINKIIPIEYKQPKKEKPNKRKLKGIQKSSDLSAHDHRLVLFEYIEEQPPLLNNVGMATKICNYYKNPENEQDLPPSVDDGIPILVDSEESIPLIGKLEDGKFLKSTENTLYSSQIFKHEVNETDFILTTRATENGIKFYVREIPIIYSVGHTQPHIECPAPNSRQAIQFTKNRLNLFIYRQFAKAPSVDEMKIRIDDIRETFPTMSETSIRKRLKECADFQRGGDASGYWTAKKDFKVPPEDQLFDLVTPEMVAMNESMEAGQLRLDETGVTNDASMAGFAFSSSKLGSGFQKYSDVINFIENERKNTPWNKTSNFINAVEGKEGSKLELLSIANQNLKKEEMEQLSKIAEEVGRIESEKTHQISLSHEEARQILIEKGGYSEERVQKMASRTERKIAARKILESLGQGGRKNIVKEKAKNTKFREILTNIFLREAKKLEHGTPYYEDGKEDDFSTGLDDIDSDNDSDFSDLEEELEKTFKSDDEEDDEELNDLLNKKSKKSNLDSDSDSDTMSVKSMESTTSKHDESKKKKYFVRKTTTIHHPDGTKEDKVEIIRDPNLVEYYISRREKKSSSKKEQTQNSSTDTTHSAKDRRRLQDQFRRWVKEKEKKAERLGSGETLQSIHRERKPKLPSDQKPKRFRTHQAKIKTNIKCGTCGNVGHMSTNRSCPKFSESKHAKALLQEGGSSNRSLEDTPTGVTINKDGNKSGLKISIPTSILAQGKNAKKKGELEYLASPVTQSKRRRKTTTDLISDIFNKIMDTVKQHPCAAPFLNPVDKILFPDYKKIISKPIDLSSIHRKIANLEYLDSDTFIKDFELMASNAHTYCDVKFPMVPPQADQVVELAKLELKKYEVELEEIINAPATPASTPVSKKKKKDILDLDLDDSSNLSFGSPTSNSTPSLQSSSTLDFSTISETPIEQPEGIVDLDSIIERDDDRIDL